MQKEEMWSRIKDRNSRLAQGEDEVLRNKWQSKCVALMGFRELTTLEESKLEELRLR